ncbi:hypothetical protein DS745_15215 [Anaerobacillus alkaliphilus]|uniref:Ligand-binding SRPBCC domain-containing protein n=1 Tax=Anaerobacillus alkaliphilus TaxID=1548597 RepID=A0A4Q0VR91_9BACI|nr:hypothetical protein [Anaerobacillus alkaliphilus]RXI99557.1 hypothetical protein DS745_15215 [Anaerobacillus alkaliphilus]
MFKGNFSFRTYLSTKSEKTWEFFNDINNLVKITSYPKVNILKHEGTREGSKTELQLDFLLFKKNWELTYIEVKEGQYFIDRSSTLPFPFKRWEHRHSFQSFDEGTLMIDDVEFESYLPSSLAKIILYIMFKSRQNTIKKHLT